MDKKQEAIKRMKALGIMPEAITQFEEDGKVNCSTFLGILHLLTDNQQKIVDEFEKEYGGLVYHCIEHDSPFGKCLVLLYVSDYPEEWEYDEADLKYGYPIAYAHNYDAPDFSEFGSVGVKAVDGCLVRTA